MKTARTSQIRFAVCIKNKGYEASLELGKLYPVIPDKKAAGHGYLRIVDESGEDYGYAADRFFAIAVPKPLQKVLLRRSRDNRLPNLALQRSGARGARPGR
jgi:hypothetical protein